ncbi:MAG: alpha/beta hydrolase fold domain-containing protein [Chloroflexota bacterium]
MLKRTHGLFYTLVLGMILAACGLFEHPTTSAGVEIQRDLVYGSYTLAGDEHALLLDLYPPARPAEGASPLVIYVHGGGWVEGDKSGCPAEPFTSQGYAVACVNYRLADMGRGCPPELSFPAQIQDVKAAVRWLRQHAAEYNLDAGRFAALGDSSGGHLAALLGTSAGVEGLAGGQAPGVSEAVQVVVDWYGPVDIRQGPLVFQDDPCQTGLDELTRKYGGEATPYFYWTLAWGAFLGGSLSDPAVLEHAGQATPLSYIDAADPPFLIIHGEQDGLVPLEQSQMLAQALAQAGVEVEFLRLEGAGHSYGSGLAVSPEFLQPTLDFLAAHLSILPAPTSPATPGAARASVTPVALGPDEVGGLVVDEDGPLYGATVRIQATRNQAITDGQGRFLLSGLVPGEPVTVSAWKDGYYCAKVEALLPPVGDIVLKLHRYQSNDNPAYAWVPPVGEDSCYSCKPGVTQVWLDNDAHSRSARNPRFLTLYNGTDVQGDASPPTHYRFSRDYGRVPLRPDLSQPYYGPGYKLDFPETAGNCAACHIPGAASQPGQAYAVDPGQVSGVDAFGVHCDFCHKIAAVRLDVETGLPYPNMPGVLSMDIRRPFPEDPERYQLFFGSFDDDNVPEEDTFLPLIQESQFCAPCHFGVFWDTVVYNSFGEWLASPYSDPASGKTCQACHMPAPTLVDGQPLTNVAPGKGGVERDPLSIPAHTFPGAASQELLQNAVTLQVDARREGGKVVVQVSITNDQTGHHVPTDSPLRHLILLVSALDGQGDVLEQVDGPTVPEWGGVGDSAQGYYAGLPGKAFAKVLEELWTEISPSGAYWNPTRLLSDNRLAAFATDTSLYTFEAPPSGQVDVAVRLWFRRAFVELIDQKGWDTPDILMESARIELPAAP